ncbi:MAG: efflux RND transporter permease subunit [Holophagales bacterium]|nr:efflux RND transporter permease subunit [Holophagales bacterium]
MSSPDIADESCQNVVHSGNEKAPAATRSLSRLDDRPFVTLRVERASGSHLLRLASAVHARLGELRSDLPEGVVVGVAEDRSEDVRAELREMAVSGGLSLLLVLAVLICMLRRPRAVGVVVLGTAASLAVALTAMHPLGLTLNLLTLAGLLLVVGLLVDNGVIVAERRLLGGSRGTSELWLPLAAGTATTVAVLGPFLYLGGDLRPLFLPLGVLLAVTLVASLGIFAFLAPAVRPGRPRPARPSSSRQRRARDHRRAFGLALYRWAALRPRTTLALLLLAVGLPTPLVPGRIDVPTSGWASADEERRAERWNLTLGSEGALRLRHQLEPWIGGITRPFLETVRRGERWGVASRPALETRVELPAGSGPHRVEDVLRAFEADALAAPGVERVLTHVRGDRGQLRVLFDKGLGEGMLTPSPPEAAARGDGSSSWPYRLREAFIRRAMGLAGLDVATRGLVSSSYQAGVGVASGYWIEASGPSFEGLLALCDELAARLRRQPRVAEVASLSGRFGSGDGSKVLRLGWDSEATARTGWWPRDVISELRPRLALDAPIARLDLDGRPDLPVRVVLGEERVGGMPDPGGPSALHQLVALPLAGPGVEARLAEHASLTLETRPGGIERRDQRYRRYLRVAFRGPHRLAEEVIDRELERTSLASGYLLERPSRVFLTAAAEDRLHALLAASVFLVYLFLAAAFESWRLPWVVLASLPAAFFGVALAFVLTDAPFAEGAFLGCILLVGVAVNDSILLVDAYRRERRRPRAAGGRWRRVAALRALRRRWRPMWTTTATSVAGMLPLWLLADAGELWPGLAITVIGGLLASTLLAPAATIALLSSGRPNRR